MDDDSARKGAANAIVNEKAFGPVALELIAISAGSGWYFSSWYVFAGVLLWLLFIYMIKPLAKILAFALSVMWGGIGYAIGNYFDSEPTKYTLAVLGFLISMATHLAAIQHIQDITGAPDNPLKSP